MEFYRAGKWETPLTFAAKHRDFETRMSSRSGGVFTAISDVVLKRGGTVYGCVLDADFRVGHARAETAELRDRIRGSKYVQSDMGETFRAVLDDLRAGRHVLFSGTSCQVAGLYGFLGKDYETLLTIDIVCHGVPSPAVWRDYLAWQERRLGKRIKSVDFRNKRDFGWKWHVDSIVLEDGTQMSGRIYTGAYYSHLFLRPCCYRCPYKDVIHPGNVTIADYWGIDEAVPGFNDNNGVSLVLINDDKGMAAFEGVRDSLEVVATDLRKSMQPPLVGPFERPEGREKAWAEYRRRGFDYIARKHGGYGLVATIQKYWKRLRGIR